MPVSSSKIRKCTFSIYSFGKFRFLSLVSSKYIKRVRKIRISWSDNFSVYFWGFQTEWKLKFFKKTINSYNTFLWQLWIQNDFSFHLIHILSMYTANLCNQSVTEVQQKATIIANFLLLQLLFAILADFWLQSKSASFKCKNYIYYLLHLKAALLKEN